jgi:hypothetical protein
MDHWLRFGQARRQREGIFPMTITSVTATSVTPPAPIAPPEASAPKKPEKPPEVNNAAAADGTRLPQPTVLAPLPPGQGTRVDQLA